MKEFACRKCGSGDLFIEQHGNQLGLYCSDCGAWQKWLSPEEWRLASNWINEYKKVTCESTVLVKDLDEALQNLASAVQQTQKTLEEFIKIYQEKSKELTR